MKRAIWLLLTALVLVACGSGATPEATLTPAPRATPQLPTATPLPENATTAVRILARGYIVVGVRYDLQPFGYITDAGEVAGFDVDLGHELARRWLGDPQAVQFRQVRSDTAVEHLQAGDVDIVIAALAHTQDREAGADFSLPYFADGQALLVRATDAAIIAGPANLAGVPVGVVARGDAENTLPGVVPLTLTLQTYARFDAAATALGAGEVAAVADLRSRLFWGCRMAAGTVVIGQYTAKPLALAFPQNDAFFADLVNLTFQEMVSDGTYADLYARWFAPDPPPAVERWPGDQVPVLANAPVVASAPNTIAAIQARRRLIVAFGADRYPFAYPDATGAPEGYDVRLVRRIAERWLGSDQVVDFVPTTLDTGQEMLRSGQADILIGGLPHTRAAEMNVDFSLTTYVAGEGLLVAKGSPIVDLAGLNGQQVAVVEGDESRENLLAAAQAAGISLTVLPQPTLDAAIALLNGGQVAAVAGDRIALLKPAYTTSGLAVLPLRLNQTPLALGLPPGDSAFRDLVNLTLQAMKAEGQFDAIYTAWFDDAAPAMEVWPGAPYRPLSLNIAVSQ